MFMKVTQIPTTNFPIHSLNCQILFEKNLFWNIIFVQMGTNRLEEPRLWAATGWSLEIRVRSETEIRVWSEIEIRVRLGIAKDSINRRCSPDSGVGKEIHPTFVIDPDPVSLSVLLTEIVFKSSWKVPTNRSYRNNNSSM